MSESKKIYDFIIFGAGITGAIIHAFLKNKSYKSLVIEKKSVIGGRFSTVEINGKYYNDGNLFLRDSHHNLVQMINSHLNEHLQEIVIDYLNIIDNQYHVDTRSIYLPQSGKMSDIVTQLMSDAEVKMNYKCESIRHENDLFHCKFINHENEIKAKHLIFAAISNSLNEVLNTLGIHLKPTRMIKISTLMCQYQTAQFDYPYYKFINHPIFKEIFIDKKQKTITIHSHPIQLDENDTNYDNEVKSLVLEQFYDYFKETIEIATMKTWNYAVKKDGLLELNHFAFGTNHLFLAGEWISNKGNLQGVEDALRQFLICFNHEMPEKTIAYA